MPSGKPHFFFRRPSGIRCVLKISRFGGLHGSESELEHAAWMGPSPDSHFFRKAFREASGMECPILLFSDPMIRASLGCSGDHPVYNPI